MLVILPKRFPFFYIYFNTQQYFFYQQVLLFTKFSTRTDLVDLSVFFLHLTIQNILIIKHELIFDTN